MSVKCPNGHTQSLYRETMNDRKLSSSFVLVVDFKHIYAKNARNR